MLCGALGAGDSLLLLLGDSVKPKGRMPPPSPLPPSPRLRSSVAVRIFFFRRSGQSEDGAVWLGAAVSLFRGGGGGGGGARSLQLHRCCGECDLKKGGLLVSVSRHRSGGDDRSPVGVQRPPAVRGRAARQPVKPLLNISFIFTYLTSPG